MRIAVISDIHANIRGLRLVAQDIKEKKHEKVVCLGDIVGFHTHPGECIDLLKKEGVFCILGNHDAGVIGLLRRSDFPPECWDAIEWTRNRLSAEHLIYLRSLRKEAIVDSGIWLMHGYFQNVKRYLVGHTRVMIAAARLKLRNIRIGFYGHTHNPMILRVGGKWPFDRLDEIQSLAAKVDKDSVYLCNPGTVGQPRSSDESASYLTFDSKNCSITFHRIRYDYREVLKETLDVFPHHKDFYSAFQAKKTM